MIDGWPMSDAAQRPKVGAIGWVDLTVPNAQEVLDFYRQVVGWTETPVDMGGYSDWCVNEPETGRTVAGICHARGSNAKLPAQWLVYITVEDVDASATRVVELGGELVVEPYDMGGHGRMCVIRDPGGAVAALFAPAGESA